MNKKAKLTQTTENSNVSLYPACLVGRLLTSEMHKLTSTNYPKMLCIFNNGKNRWANNVIAANKMSKQMIKRLENEPKYVQETLKKYKTAANLFSKVIDELLHLTESSSLEELILGYKTYNKHFLKVHLYGWLPLAVEGFEGNFSKKLLGIIKKANRTNIDTSEIYNIIITHRTLTIRQEEYISLLNILLFIYSDNKLHNQFSKNTYKTLDSNNRLKLLLRKHIENFRSMSFDYEGPELEDAYFIERLIALFDSKIDPGAEISEINNSTKTTIKKQKEILASLNLSREIDKCFLEMGRILLEWKDDLQKLLFRSYFAIDKVIGFMAQKKNTSKQIIRNILPEEIEKFTYHDTPSADEIIERIKFCVMICEDRRTVIEIGQKAHDLLKREVEVEVNNNVNTIKGQGVFAGVVEATVRIIMDYKEMHRMMDGDILVSSKTNPNMLPAMMKASAIITDYGGITCHAAIISQEMKIPALIGTKIATKVLKDGMVVRVDTRNGTAEILNNESV